MNIKKIFCKHIDEELGKKKLYEQREAYPIGFGGITTYATFTYYVSQRQCIKCGREKFVETRVLNI